MLDAKFNWNLVRQILVPLVVLVIGISQAVTYALVYPLRVGYIDYGDALLFMVFSGFVYALILVFQRSIHKTIARVALQSGWTLILIVGLHTALIQVFDRNYPYHEDTIPDTLITLLHEDTNLVVVFGVIVFTIGIYYWAMDIGMRERRFNSVVAAMPVGVAVIDLEGRILLYNEGFTKILAVPDKDLLNSNLYDQFNIDDHILGSEMGSEPYGPIQLDIALEIADAPKKYLSVDMVANKDRFGRIDGHIVVISDNTTRRQAEEEREQQRRVIELYTSLLSHDIGNDLQAVLGYIEAVSMMLKDDFETAQRMLTSAEAAGQRMANLVRTFKNEASPAHINIAEMLDRIAKEAETISMNLTVHLDVSQSVMALRSPGGSLLRIAFDNILRNAAQHAGTNPKVIVRAIKENDELVIRFTDNGPGIPPEIQKSIFYRSDPKQERGLGLYLAKQIITACGGTIEIEPGGTGATFKVALPLVE